MIIAYGGASNDTVSQNMVVGDRVIGNSLLNSVSCGTVCNKLECGNYKHEFPVTRLKLNGKPNQKTPLVTRCRSSPLSQLSGFSAAYCNLPVFSALNCALCL